MELAQLPLYLSTNIPESTIREVQLDRQKGESFNLVQNQLLFWLLLCPGETTPWVFGEGNREGRKCGVSGGAEEWLVIGGWWERQDSLCLMQKGMIYKGRKRKWEFWKKEGNLVEESRQNGSYD